MNDARDFTVAMLQTWFKSPVAQPDLALPEIALRVERSIIVKRIWRGAAEDGTEFGFPARRALKDGETIWGNRGGALRDSPAT